jgi:hypothetical protein
VWTTSSQPGDEPKFAGPWARESKKDLGGTRKLTLM